MAKNFTWRYFTAATLLCFFFSATFTTVNAQCDATTKPTITFYFNGEQVANVNNGTVDASELASLTTCSGESYSVEGYYHSSEANLYLINNAVSGGTLLLDGNTVTNSQSVITAAQIPFEPGAIGFHSLTLATPGVGGTLIQTMTPFTDANNNKILDDGDCAGEPIVFTYTVVTILTWYLDYDNDLHARDTMHACFYPGLGWTKTVLPLDDCLDTDPQNNLPTLIWGLNGSLGVQNINNGVVDPSERATVPFCEGERFGWSGPASSNEYYNLYKIANVVTGDALLYDGGAVRNSDTVLNNAELKRMEATGTHAFTLVDGVNGSTLVQTITPFLDANRNRILDDGDCLGEPIVFTFIITAGSLWYKDVDGDLHAARTKRSCVNPGQGWTTTKLPVDDCDDNDINNAGPTFGFNFNGTPVYNINNGSVDPSESATLTICEGESYSTSGHFHNSESNLYRVVNVVSGGTLELEGLNIINSESVITAAQLSSTAGTYTFKLVNPGVGGTLVQRITPFRDLNNNGILDFGDCVGDRIVFTYKVTPGVTWYKDVDGDLHASATKQSCPSPGQGWTTTVLPLDDCNDNDVNNSGPTFGFNFNGTAVANISNGTVDPGETASLTICDGESYSTSGHFYSSFSNLYFVKHTVSGGTLVINGTVIVNSEGVITSGQLSGTAGTYTLTLANPAVGGVLIQKITPFSDANNNGIPDEGDCVGDPIVFTYTVTTGSKTWYKDADGDGYGGQSCHVRACVKPAGYVSCNTDCDDNNKLVHEPITYYRDADGDGYGDPNSSISECKSNAPSGYVKNNYDWNDQNKAGKACDERITMCLNGNTEIVYVKYMDKKLSQGWKPGPCSNGTIKVTKGANDKPEKTARNTADQTIPEEYSLSNAPNPFKGTSTIKYALPVDSKVLIVVYDITGRNLGTLVNGDKKAGNYTVNFNAVGLSNGIYYYRIAAKSGEGRFDQTNKMILAR